MTDVTVRGASVALLVRYRELLTTSAAVDGPKGCDTAHLLWMCNTAIGESQAWPEDKLSRWLGFVQGVLCVAGVLLVDEERDISRPLFHAAYASRGQPLPPTLEPRVPG